MANEEPLTPIADAEREIQAEIEKCKADPKYLDTLIDEGTIEATVRLRAGMKGAYGKALESKVKLWERLLMSRPTASSKPPKASRD